MPLRRYAVDDEEEHSPLFEGLWETNGDCVPSRIGDLTRVVTGKFTLACKRLLSGAPFLCCGA